MAGTSFLLRAVGMAFRVYLSNYLGADGLGLNQLIGSVGSFVALLCSTGISMAVTRLCAERPLEAKAITRRAQILSVSAGLGVCLLVFMIAPLLTSGVIRDERALAPLRIYALALPLIAASSCVKGYFFSKGEVGRVTAAQIIEQFARIGLSVFLIERLTKPGDIGLSLTIVYLCTTLGELISVVTLEAFFAGRKEKNVPLAAPAFGPLLSIGVPIMLATLLQSGIQTVENLLIPPMLSLSGTGNAMAEYGLLNGMVLPVLFFPAALPAAIGTLRMPAVARLNALGDENGLRKNVRLTLISTMMVSMLFMALFASLATPLMQSLYKNGDAAAILLVLSPLLPLLYLDRISDALLKGIGRQRATLYVEIFDSSLRLLMVLFLVPMFGLKGLLATFGVSSLLTCLIRVFTLLRACKLRANALTATLHASLPSVISGAFACLAGLMVAALPLPPVFVAILGGITVFLTFFTFFTFLNLRHRKKHEVTAYRL